MAREVIRGESSVAPTIRPEIVPSRNEVTPGRSRRRRVVALAATAAVATPLWLGLTPTPPVAAETSGHWGTLTGEVDHVRVGTIGGPVGIHKVGKSDWEVYNNHTNHTVKHDFTDPVHFFSPGVRNENIIYYQIATIPPYDSFAVEFINDRTVNPWSAPAQKITDVFRLPVYN